MDKTLVQALIISAIAFTVMGLAMYDIAKDNKKRGIKPKKLFHAIVEVEYLGVVGTEVKQGGFMGAMIGSFLGGDLGMVVGGMAPRGIKTRCRFRIRYENGKEKTEDCYEGDGRYDQLMNIIRMQEQKGERMIKAEHLPSLNQTQMPKERKVATQPKASIEPYSLKKNELPQGKYLIGRDIPPGTYDFFVVYGNGGKFDMCKYDESGKIIDRPGKFYWVGLKETYENSELIHVHCPEGYNIEISGNVILKIAKSQEISIDL